VSALTALFDARFAALGGCPLAASPAREPVLDGAATASHRSARPFATPRSLFSN